MFPSGIITSWILVDVDLFLVKLIEEPFLVTNCIKRILSRFNDN